VDAGNFELHGRLRGTAEALGNWFSIVAVVETAGVAHDRTRVAAHAYWAGKGPDNVEHEDARGSTWEAVKGWREKHHFLQEVYMWRGNRTKIFALVNGAQH